MADGIQMSLFDEYGNDAPDRRSGEMIECLKASEGLKASRRMRKLAKQKAVAEPPKDSYSYWLALERLVVAWIDYIKADKLVVNYDDDDCRHKVEDVINGYHGGIKKLREKRTSARKQFLANLDYYNGVCVRYGVKSVNRSWFPTNLYAHEDYDSYRGRIRVRVKKSEKYPPVALVDFPPRKVKK